MGSFSHIISEDELNHDHKTVTDPNIRKGTASFSTGFGDFIDILFEPVIYNWSTFKTEQDAEFNVYLNIPGLYEDSNTNSVLLRQLNVD